jgi:hypothetical protein
MNLLWLPVRMIWLAIPISTEFPQIANYTF